MKDFEGTELKIGDTVIFTGTGLIQGLLKRTVIDIGTAVPRWGGSPQPYVLLSATGHNNPRKSRCYTSHNLFKIP